MFRRKLKPNPLPAEKFSPEPDMTADVRYALKHREGNLNANDISGLFGADDLKPVAFYMAMKAAGKNYGIQRTLLERVADQHFDLSKLRLEDAQPALEHLDSATDRYVQAFKLNPIRALGIKAWTRRFTESLGPAIAANPDAALFAVTHATYPGIRELAALSLARGNQLDFIDPKQIARRADPVGFTLRPTASGVSVDYLPYDFKRPADAIVFDDVAFTGAVRKQVAEFWGGSVPLPQFVTAVTVQGPGGLSHPSA